MPALPSDLDFFADRAASPARMDRAMSNLHGRISALETYKPNFDAQLAQIQQIGLTRLNDVMMPIYDALVVLTHLGAVFTAQSSTSLAIDMGLKAFVIDDLQQRQTFAPAQWLSAMTADALNAMAGRLVSYDRDSGTLVIYVMETYGGGTVSPWIISASSPPLLGAQVIDGGVDEGDPIEAELIPYLYSGTAVASSSPIIRTVVNPGDITMAPADSEIIVAKTVAQATNILLIDSTTALHPLVVKDFSRRAGNPLYRINLVPTTGQFVDGLTPYPITIDGAVVKIKPNPPPLPAGWYVSL